MYSYSKFAFITLLVIVLSSFNLPKNIEKKVTKEITSFFDIDSYTKKPIIVSSDINKKLPTKIGTYNLFAVNNNEIKIGYLYVGKAPSKTDEFDYMVLFDTELNIIKSKVLIYREDYGNEIGSRRWLKQFNGKTSNDTLRYEDNVDAISGATISARSMTIAVNNLLKTIGVLQENKIL